MAQLPCLLRYSGVLTAMPRATTTLVFVLAALRPMRAVVSRYAQALSGVVPVLTRNRLKHISVEPAIFLTS
jgi:hypothetical protein